MRHTQLILVAIAAITATFTLNAQEQPAKQGDDLYRAADYAAAISAYEDVLAQGKESADLYYNLGNAYYREGQYARAILNYERALRLKPNMHDAKENLDLANSQTIDRITPLPQLMVTRWYKHLTTHITPAAWQIVWLVLLAAVCMALIAIRVGNNMHQKKIGLYAGIVMLVLLIAATVFMTASASHYSSHDDAIVIEPAISIKSSPEVQSTDKLILHEGTKVHIIESLTDWYRVSIADGTTGWCEASAIEQI